MRFAELSVGVVVDELECVNGAPGLSEDGMDGLEHGIRVGGRIVLKGRFQSEDGFVARDGRDELHFEEEGDGWAFVCHLVYGNHLGVKGKRLLSQQPRGIGGGGISEPPRRTVG